MAAIDQAVVKGYIDAGKNAATTTDRGRALEDLVCYVFGQVPGITITRRNAMNAFATQEIDVALWNERDAAGMHFFPNIVLVECKNWDKRVSSSEVSWFDTKLRSRGLEYGLLVAMEGITGDADDLRAAHSIVAAALAERRRLIVLTRAELVSLADTDALMLLLREKLCDLAVRGTLA